MARNLRLYQWTGIAPREARVDHRIQVSCAAAFTSKAEFMRVTRNPRSMVDNYVNIGNEASVNEGALLAFENPGVVYYKDDLRHPQRDAPWLVHPEPGFS